MLSVAEASDNRRQIEPRMPYNGNAIPVLSAGDTAHNSKL